MHRKIEINSQRKEVGNSSWVETPVTLACLTTTLITFEFKGIQNIKTELDFTRYIVSHSSKLEKLRILTPTSKKRIIQYLLQDINSMEDHMDAFKDSIKTTRHF